MPQHGGHRHGGPWCALALLVLAPVVTAGDGGPPECEEQAVSADGRLELLPKKPLREWARVKWKMGLDAGSYQLILVAERNKPASVPKSPFSGRAVFQEEPLSLRISPVHATDTGTYKAEFEDPGGGVSTQCFRVSVWGPPACEEQAVSANGMLELLPKKPLREWTRVRWEMGPDAGSYQLILVAERNKPASVPKSPFSGRAVFQEEPLSLRISPVHATDTGIYEAEFEDPGGGASTQCFRVSVWGHSSIIPGWAVAVAVAVLALAIAIALVITFYWRRKRRKDPPGGHIEQTLTVYEEVGKAQAGRDPSATRNEATSGENTIYAVICKAQGPSLPREPESRTIYTSLQPTRKSPSLRRKRLDPALISTAYAEATGFSRHPPSQMLSLAPTGHHLS